MLKQSQLMMLFVLTCKLQEVFASTFEWSYRMDQNLAWHSFSTDPSCVANYKEIRRGHVNFMLIWYGMTHCLYLRPAEIWYTYQNTSYHTFS